MRRPLPLIAALLASRRVARAPGLSDPGQGETPFRPLPAAG